jgi:hypothetical protein
VTRAEGGDLHVTEPRPRPFQADRGFGAARRTYAAAAPAGTKPRGATAPSTGTEPSVSSGKPVSCRHVGRLEGTGPNPTLLPALGGPQGRDDNRSQALPSAPRRLIADHDVERGEAEFDEAFQALDCCRGGHDTTAGSLVLEAPRRAAPPRRQALFWSSTAGARVLRARSPCAATPPHGSGRRSAPSGADGGSRRRRTRSVPSSPRPHPR